MIRKLFTEYSTQLVIGLVAVLVAMRLVLARVKPDSPTARFILWFWHPDVRADRPAEPVARTRRHAPVPPEREPVDYPHIWSITLQNMDSTLLALALVFFVIRPFVIQAFYIPSSSMEPTLYGSPGGRQDRVLVNKYLYRFRPPRRGDIIVFHAPPAALVDGRKQDYIKRVIGVPGDVVEVKNHRPIINGLTLQEPYIESYPEGPFYGLGDGRGNPANFGPVTVPPHCYLVMGDNRGNSHDSRLWGHWEGFGEDRHFVHEPFVPERNILGKAMCVFWPIVELEPNPGRDYGGGWHGPRRLRLVARLLK